MKKLSDSKQPFNFKRYQHAKKSRKMLIRYIIYSFVIGVLLYLIITKGFSLDEKSDNENIEVFDIETKDD